jgi:hypothetical protein
VWLNYREATGRRWLDLGTPPGVGVHRGLGASIGYAGEPFAAVQTVDADIWKLSRYRDTWGWGRCGSPLGGAALTTWSGANRAGVYVPDQSSQLWALLYDGTGWSWTNLSA